MRKWTTMSRQEICIHLVLHIVMDTATSLLLQLLVNPSLVALLQHSNDSEQIFLFLSKLKFTLNGTLGKSVLRVTNRVLLESGHYNKTITMC